MKISFIIVNYKSGEYLDNCLKSIFENVLGVEFEIIIVNNDEVKISDKAIFFAQGCVEKLTPKECLEKKRDESKKIVIIENNKNVGFGSANNLGVLVSRGEILCFLNPDTEIVSSNIKKIVDKFNLEGDIGALGPQILIKGEINKVQAWSAGVDLTILEILRGKMGISQSKRIWSSENELEADWITGACLFVRKRIFLQINGFDEKFFLYYEDLDLCKRIKKANQRIIFYPEFKVAHWGSKSSKNNLKQKEEYFKSQDYYYAKWFSVGAVFFFKNFKKNLYLEI